MINVPIPICTALLQARLDLCFISLIKSLNLNFAGLLTYFAAHHGRPNLKPESFTRPFAVRTALLAWAGAAAGEQTADHGGGELGDANQPQLNPQQATSASAQPGRCSGTDKGAAKQQ